MSDFPAFPSARPVTIPAHPSEKGTPLAEITLSVHDAGTGPTVVLCHGWPEIAFSWRKQFGALVDAGFRVIAPDMRGFGASDSPEVIEAFDLEHLTGDLAGLLDVLGIDEAVFVGHDWGGFVVWAMPIAYPQRTAGVIGVNTPYVPFPSTSMLRRLFQDTEKLYILWFQRPGVAEAVMDRNPRVFFQKIMRYPIEPNGPAMMTAGGDIDANPFRHVETLEDRGEVLLTEPELDTYTRAYEKAGFRGGVNWYRNIDRNMGLYPGIGSQKLDLPCLMVTSEWDPALPPTLAAGMPMVCSDLETHQIAKCGHWTMQEKPEDLNRVMVDWLGRRFSSKGLAAGAAAVQGTACSSPGRRTAGGRAERDPSDR